MIRKPPLEEKCVNFIHNFSDLDTRGSLRYEGRVHTNRIGSVQGAYADQTTKHTLQ